MTNEINRLLFKEARVFAKYLQYEGKTYVSDYRAHKVENVLLLNNLLK
jgi:hypothetical protein